ncbi:hypothetical protein HHL19_35800 [Streptomyces sp. R302]|uniref:hypothetical protein n=1 Tax=unclassified Streptomyces TaxID=2593676 RepID=UPI00145E4879|nr:MULTISPECIES: hypothetical protein [unclassified Streptomyces]NML55095.1 hypothetical protein [Streptomyces sp. R301]NML83875.1 hypothetical protein [Streptomyces sp. R302]
MRLPRPSTVLSGMAAAAMLGALGFIGSSDATPADFLPEHKRPAAPTGLVAPRWSVEVAQGLGDDNADGRIDEDESGWNCHLMGNRLCGPDAARTSR